MRGGRQNNVVSIYTVRDLENQLLFLQGTRKDGINAHKKPRSRKSGAGFFVQQGPAAKDKPLGGLKCLEGNLELHTIDGVFAEIRGGAANVMITVVIPHQFRANPEALGQVDRHADAPHLALGLVVDI